MSKLKLSVIFLAFAGLAACANTKNVESQADIDQKRILQAINESARVIADAQRVTAESNNAIRAMSMTEQQRRAYSEAMAYIPPNMERPISMFVTNEELENVARMLATLTNYDFNVVNPAQRPRNGVLISVQSPGRTAHDVARDIGTQAGARADLVVTPYSANDKRTSKFGLIEVVYK